MPCEVTTSRGRPSLRLVGLAMLAGLLLLVTVAAQAQPLVVYGDESFPPYEFLQDGIPTGANVDLLHELGRVLDRPVEIRLTSWADAQAKVRDGTGDALSLMARTPEREDVYGFSGQTFPMTYSLFVRASDAARFGDAPLATRRIGVTSGGLPRAHFQGQHPDVPLVLVADYIDGVRRLLRGEIDAFAAATWTGNHFLRDLNISGVTPLPEPFAERTSAIAVPRANAALLAEIDRALHQLKRDGTFDRILDRWAGRRVHIVSERELWLAGAAGAATLVAVALLGILLLTTQAKRRALARRFAAHRETEAELRASEDALRRAKVELEALAADLERRVAERTAQLVQAQKMEAVGQLTSGMAHDFNNVLQGVSGCLAGLERRIPDEAARRLFDAAQQGVERGARLTRHMLAFARRQSLTPVPTDVAAMLDGMRPILERSMGGLIRIGVDVPGGTWPALVDPTQLEAAVLNLAINARDAMPLGGLLSVCAANATVTGEGGTGDPADLRPGDYVVVSVTDTGPGMDEATLARVFEPFFTTKEVGKGSGLGLADGPRHGGAVRWRRVHRQPRGARHDGVDPPAARRSDRRAAGGADRRGGACGGQRRAAAGR